MIVTVIRMPVPLPMAPNRFAATESTPVPHMFSTYNGNGLPIDSITVIAKRGLYVPPTGIPVAMTQYSGQALLNEVVMSLTAVFP